MIGSFRGNFHGSMVEGQGTATGNQGPEHSDLIAILIMIILDREEHRTNISVQTAHTNIHHCWEVRQQYWYIFLEFYVHLL